MTPSTSRHLGVLTGERAPELSDDGQAVAAALEARGFQVSPVLWTDETVDWSAYDLVLIRSCWEYHTDPERFRAVLASMEDAGVAVLNPPPVVRWNVHKSYLLDLQRRGVDIPLTVVLERGTDASLGDVLRTHGLDEAVVKPAIGTSSTNVWRVSRSDADASQDRFDALLAAGDVLVQAFVPEIAAGERSIVFFGSEYSHAWNSLTADDDVSEFVRHDAAYRPSDAIREQAAAVVRAACEETGVSPGELPYARVDYVERDGTLVLMELELVEPFLGLERGEDAVGRFAAAIVDAI